ncbi:MAG: DUF5606 domain-containing protein [Flavobacteriales bacterium]|nr:DUF5606 domain-containing protein [Flavobacteriales bacterium]
MRLKGILAISGKPGLYKLVSQGRGTIIIESLADGRRMPASATSSISALEEIAMYTDTGELQIREIMRRIAEKENNGPAPDHKKTSSGETVSYFAGIVPDYDRSRVYESHIRKLFQWYNILQKAGMVSKETEEEDENAENTGKE